MQSRGNKNGEIFIGDLGNTLKWYGFGNILEALEHKITQPWIIKGFNWNTDNSVYAKKKKKRNFGFFYLFIFF